MNRVLDMFKLDGQVALVTGGHSWLGWDAACSLAEAGAAVVISSRDRSRADEAAQRLKDLYPLIDTKGIAFNQNEYEQVQRAFIELSEWKGRLDILVNNAGGGSGKSLGDILKRDPVDMESLIKTNLTGVLYCCREAASNMVSRKRGTIINIASIAGLVGRNRKIYLENGVNQQPVDYSAAKSGVIGMTRDLAASLGPYNIRVNAISPGGFDKGQLPEGFVKDYSDMTILGRMGKMGSDLKGAALFLASDASAYVTGHNLVVDGGFSINK